MFGSVDIRESVPRLEGSRREEGGGNAEGRSVRNLSTPHARDSATWVTSSSHAAKDSGKERLPHCACLVDTQNEFSKSQLFHSVNTAIVELFKFPKVPSMEILDISDTLMMRYQPDDKRIIAD
ncbi:hypothetical protein CEXT_48601 [Caerostris extrusa]|uniref:Uncharacterized protein n=1 Tax=Caerostris extrusa TaxID=172846 RepID=A0AAV4N0U7_CAEEX|nr:hypothetical protein CEXT_48601 [Caerostris extrusa]